MLVYKKTFPSLPSECIVLGMPSEYVMLSMLGLNLSYMRICFERFLSADEVFRERFGLPIGP